MNIAETSTRLNKTPWHLWLVGVLALFWNGMGTLTILMAQMGKIPNIDPDEAVYYASQPLFLILVTDAALIFAVAGAIGLLLRSRAAVWMFGVSLVLVLFSNIYDVTAGSSRALVDSGALAFTVIIIFIGLLQLFYSFRMRQRTVLR